MPLRQRSQEPQCKEKWKLRSQDKIFLVGDYRKPSTHTDTPHCSRGTGRENWKNKSQKLVSQDKCSLIGEGKNEKRKKEAQEIHSPPPQAEQCPASPQKWLLRSQTPPSSSLPDFIAPHNILWHRISPWPLGASWVLSPPLPHPQGPAWPEWDKTKPWQATAKTSELYQHWCSPKSQ